MHVDEEQLARWAKPPGQTEQDKCDNAVTAVKKAIDASDVLSDIVNVFPQGSYRARTNTRQNSDVDICICHKTSFFPDYPEGRTRDDYGNVDAAIPFDEFKNLVEEALVDYFGQEAVTRGNKAFDIHENTYRVDADAVAVFKHRRYDSDGSNNWIEPEGIAFKPDDGGLIKNWPEQTYSNGVDKNSAERTNRGYKAVIRILKRLRDDMQDNNEEAAEDIASFLIESLAWNAPDSCFKHTTYRDDVKSVIAHTYNHTADYEKCKEWGEVNELKYLFRTSQPWTRKQANDFLLAAWNYIGFD